MITGLTLLLSSGKVLLKLSSFFLISSHYFTVQPSEILAGLSLLLNLKLSEKLYSIHPTIK